jgi:hypothetical protein
LVTLPLPWNCSPHWPPRFHWAAGFAVGAAFLGCSLLAGGAASAAPHRRTPVSANGTNKINLLLFIYYSSGIFLQ